MNPGMVGAIGEHLVCADLRKQGYISFSASSDCPYDLVLDTPHRLFRVQVKTTQKIGPRRGKISDMPTWEFKLFRSDGRGHVNHYKKGEYDILAAIALDIGLVAYLPQQKFGRNCITLRSTDYTHLEMSHWPGKYFQDYPLESVLKELGEPLAHEETAQHVLGDPL